MKTVYFARAMDGLSKPDILAHYAKVDKVLTGVGLRLVNPHQGEISLYDPGSGSDANKEGRIIVEEDLGRLRQADILLVDLSIPGHNYIGCICEIVYAWLWQKPVVVYVGDSGNESRLWLRQHATHICSTFGEALDYIEQIPEQT